MFARALAQAPPPSSQQKRASATVQKPLDFGGPKRKAFDEIDESPNKLPLPLAVADNVPKESGLMSALTRGDSFRERMVEVDGVGMVDMAEFDDDGWQDWSDPVPPKQSQQQAGGSKQNPVIIAEEEDFFKSDIEWDEFDSQGGNAGPTTLHSSPPGQQNTAPAPLEDPVPPQLQEEKENTTPPLPPSSHPPSSLRSLPPAPPPPADLAKTLFPSSAPIPWSSSPGPPPRPQRPLIKRTLPWQSSTKRIPSVPRPTTAPTRTLSTKRNISSVAMDTPAMDWDVLGLSQKDVFEHKVAARRAEMERKNEVMRRGTEWIDAPVKPVVERRKKQKSLVVEGEKKGVERKQIAKLFLSQEQLSVRKMVVEEKKSVFFTGSAGTGKSVLLREIITALKKQYERNPEVVAVTASTGLAACNVGGITLHSFAGFGLGKGDVPELVRTIKRNKKAFERWRRTKVLIIDEISMVDAVMFDKLQELARLLRKDQRPFGGIQLVITGDFFQLPPVAERGVESKFAFEADNWNKAIPNTIKLTSVFRQKDQEFVTMLNEMRLGTLSEESIKNFQSLSRKPQFDDDIEPTELYPTRNEVDSANNVRMHSLPGSTRVFTAEEGGAITNTQFRNKLLANCMAPSRLDLKKDAQVMLIKNMDDNLVNGSLGKVMGFMSENTYSLCEREGIDVESALGLDSKAAGLSDDPYGFASIEEDPEDSESVARKKRRILKLRAMSAETSQLWPLVRFTTATGLHIDRLVTREKWSFETPEGEVQAYRRQIPLILAYAISIHKAQGQTLSRVRVDLGRVFEKGQAYVALSRATCREGLQILRFDAKKVMAHPRVAAFYRQLENVEEVKRRESSKAGRLDEVGLGWDKEALDEFMEDEIVAYG